MITLNQGMPLGMNWDRRKRVAASETLTLITKCLGAITLIQCLSFSLSISLVPSMEMYRHSIWNRHSVPWNGVKEKQRKSSIITGKSFMKKKSITIYQKWQTFLFLWHRERERDRDREPTHFSFISFLVVISLIFSSNYQKNEGNQKKKKIKSCCLCFSSLCHSESLSMLPMAFNPLGLCIQWHLKRTLLTKF